MKLDPRIKSLSDVLTIFDIDRAKEFIGQKGYFADAPQYFDNIKTCPYGTLEDVFDVVDHTFRRLEGCDEDYLHFLPESSLKPIEKKYRPYTPEEFCNEFDIGERVIFRTKDAPESGHALILQGLWYRQRNGKAITYVRLGPHLYTLDELHNDFEWRTIYKKDFKPFGVEVEE